MINLPEEFQVKMKNLLQDEFDDFLKSYTEEKSKGLRVNVFKISKEHFLQINPFHLEAIPWVNNGFYYSDQDKPGKHPYHEAGLYYVQEPSAMAVGELVAPKPGERVLDLCAAPGGKTTHLAEKMKQTGLLVANEIHPSRAKILSQNVERMGIKNALVLNETPERLAERFPNFFDKILVDAPCSGEGMFRKDPEACGEWSLNNVLLCADRQIHILEKAAVMLKGGGKLVYSTCTFSPEENEGVISYFLNRHPDFELEEVTLYDGFSKGRPDWTLNGEKEVERTIRLWPHKLRGEGHFIAVLRKIEGTEVASFKREEGIKNKKWLKDFYSFTDEHLRKIPSGKHIIFGEHLYLIPEEMPSLHQLKVLRPGLHLGTFKKNRFEPAHAFALALKEEEVVNQWNFSSTEIIPYLKGESIEAKGEKGWYLIQVDGYSIGWGKLVNNILKNHFPKGLRWTN